MISSIRITHTAIFLLVCLTTYLQAQSFWTWQNPQPNNQTLSAITHAGGKFLAAGDSNVLLTSTDGTTWQRSVNTPFAGIRGLTNNGSIYVAVGDGGNIHTSPNGLDWTARTSGTSTDFNAVAWNGSIFVAVGDSGVIRTSPNAITWTARTSSGSLNCVVWNGSQFVVGGSSGIIRTSPDGVTWTSRIFGTGSSTTINGITWTGSQFVAVGTSGTIRTSPDAVTWTGRTSGTTSVLRAVTHDGSRFVAVGDNSAAVTSTDGVTWTLHNTGVSDSLHAIRHAGGIIVAVGSLGVIATSPTGSTWTNRQTGIRSYISSLEGRGGSFIALSASGASASPDGINWTQRSLLGTRRATVWTGTQLVTVGDAGSILTTTDASTWTIRNSGISTSLFGVAWNGTHFVAVGAGGRILTSSDAVTWTSSSSWTVDTLRAVTSGGGLFTVVGDSGKILTSPDGNVWTPRVSGTTQALNGIVWSGTQFVAVGAAGTLLTSPDGISWTSRISGTTNGLNAIAWNGTRLVAVGSSTTRISTDGITWVQGATSSSLSITWTGTYFVSVGLSGSVTISFDGELWFNRGSGSSSSLHAVTSMGSQVIAVGVDGFTKSVDGGSAWSASYLGSLTDITRTDGGDYLAVGNRGSLFTSSDGVSWSGLQSGTSNTLNHIHAGDGRYIVVGASGTIITSQDGLSWTVQNSGTSETLYGAFWNGSKYVVVGNTILTSPDGNIWTPHSYGGTSVMLAIAAGNGVQVTVGTNGTIVTSSDGNTWIQRSSGTTQQLNSVVWTGSHFVAAGRSGVTLSSPDGISWMSHATASTQDIAAIVWNGERLVAGGASGMLLSHTPQEIAFPNPGTRLLGPPPFTLSATASSGLPVTFEVVSGPATILTEMVGGMVNYSVSLNGLGTVTLRASQTGSSQHFPASAEVSFAVTSGASSNADLTDVLLSEGTLSPPFANETQAYQSAVPSGSNSIVITPVRADPTATVTVNGQPASVPVSLLGGSNLITILVTAQDGIATKTYTVNLTREVLGANFSSVGDVALSANGYHAGGGVVNLTLGFAPPTGTALTVLNNTSLSFISGTFSNLAHGQAVSLEFNGVIYQFVANYYGGTGNDLVLQWANVAPTAWGGNQYGQLGYEYTTASTANSSVPVVVNPTGALSGKTVISLEAGFGHMVALCSDGTLAAWGWNDFGQLGNNSMVDSATPVAVNQTGVLAGKTVISVSVAENSNVALCSDGTLVAWGRNEFGQLGNNSTVDSSVPVAVTQTGVLTGKTVVAVKAGGAHTLALCSDGTLVAWGLNRSGQLGNNSTTNSSVPVAVSQTGVLAGKTIIAMAAGSYVYHGDSHSVVLCSDGTLAVWGWNGFGQLGNNSTFNSPIPVAVNQMGVLLGKTVVSVDAGMGHTIALCSDGTLAAWGWNDSGQLGDNSTVDRYQPVAVNQTGVLLGKTVVSFSAGSAHTLALCSDGTLASWGYNNFGQLGYNSITSNSSAPVAVFSAGALAGKSSVSVAAGFLNTVALVASPPEASNPSVVSLLYTELTTSTATLNGEVLSDGGDAITERGFVYSPTATNANPVLGGDGVVSVTSPGTTGAFSVILSDLPSGTAYSFKAYATNSIGTAYSALATFTTLASPPVAIADANLEAALRTVLSKPTGPITEADMLTLTNLNLSGLGLTDLSGLQFAGNLRILNIRSNAFADVAATWAILDQLPLYCLYADIPRPGGNSPGLITQSVTDTFGGIFYIVVDAPNLPTLDISGLGIDTSNQANLAALQVFSAAGVTVETGGTNLPPVANATATILNIPAGTVSLNGTASSDIDGTVASWAWAWSGGSATGANPTVTLPVGETTVTLTVADDDGATSSTTVTVDIVTLASAIQDSGLTGDNALPNATPFNDGVENLLKYAFNMNLAGPDASTLPPGIGTGGLPAITTPEDAPEGTLRFEFLRRKGSGLVYAPRKSTTLDGATWSPLAAAPVVTSINDQWERVVYTEAPDLIPAPACFGRVEVTVP